MITPMTRLSVDLSRPLTWVRRWASTLRGMDSRPPERLITGDTIATNPPATGPVPTTPTDGAIGLETVETVPVQSVWGQINTQMGRAYFPGDLFVNRDTLFDQNVLTARYLHQHPEFSLLYRRQVISLLAQAEQSAVQSQRLDQVMWLAQAYQGEFSELPNAMYKAATLEQTARSMLAGGSFTISPYQYPHVNYGLVPTPGLIPGFNDPFGLPPALTAPYVPREVYERNRANSQSYWNMMGGR